MSNSLYSSDVDILINGKPVKKYSHNGKLFIEAKEGSEYTIKIKNSTWSRKLAVASVDGINVIDGEAAGASQNGYIINGTNSYEIKGFRVSNSAVNAFKFTKKDNSYAAKSEQTGGDTSNVGVIGVKIYSERIERPAFIKKTFLPERRPWTTPHTPWDETPIPWKYPEVTWSSMTRSTAEVEPQKLVHYENNDICCGGGHEILDCTSFTNVFFNQVVEEKPRGFDLGTEFSDKEVKDEVTEVEFKTGSLEATIEIYYASRESLIQMGVPIEKEALVAFPTAFPSKFCKPPKK